MSDKICVGAIAGSYGVRGEVRLKSFCAEPDSIEDYAPLTSEDGSQSFSVILTGQIKHGFTARLTNIRSKEEADALKGVRLYADRDQLPDLPDDEFYYADLVGLAVLDAGGQPIGKVKSVQNHGAGDLLEVEGPGLKASVLVPFTKEAVPTVDLASGRVIIDPPEGILG